jgi:hypothetical protein
MDSRLERSTKSLSSFLEEDTSPAFLGISDAARNHLSKFREFLRDFYSQKFGTWPPRTVFTKAILRSMHSDFLNLHDYLVDLNSSAAISEQGLASGGICVFQITQAFDKRHSFEPLLHPHARLPNEGGLRRSSSKKTLVALGLGPKQEVDPKSDILTAAANTSNLRVLNAPLVKAYQIFEGDSITEKSDKLSLSDSRKSRWILVYCTFQILTSVTRAPPAVRDTESPTYPLCCDSHDLPPWREPSPPPTRASRASNSKSRQPLSINALMQGTPTTRPETAKSRPGNSKLPLKSSMSARAPVAPDCRSDNYIKHIDVPIPSWKDVFSMRDPSTVAFNELAKQMDSKGTKARKNSATPNSGSRFNLLGRKGNDKDKERERERAKMPTPLQMARKGSTSTGHSSRSNKSGSMTDRMESVRSGSRSTDALSKPRSIDALSMSPSIDALSMSPSIDVVNRKQSADGPRAVEPRSPQKAAVAPWESMEPTMSGAMDPSARPISNASKMKDHSRAKSIPLVP